MKRYETHKTLDCGIVEVTDYDEAAVREKEFMHRIDTMADRALGEIKDMVHRAKSGIYPPSSSAYTTRAALAEQYSPNMLWQLQTGAFMSGQQQQANLMAQQHASQSMFGGLLSSGIGVLR